MNGISRWVCGSIPPGITKQPVASSTLSPDRPLPMATIFPSSILTSDSYVRSAVTIVPPLMTVLAMISYPLNR